MEDNVSVKNPHVCDMKDVTLKGLQQFYASEFIGNIYTYEYEYKQEEESKNNIPIIQLEFAESNMCHLLGIQHIVSHLYNKNTYTGQSGYDKIADDDLNINILRGISKVKFKGEKDRFKYFKCIKDIINEPDLILYNKDKSNSEVDSKYILYKLIGTSYVHLGIDVDYDNNLDTNIDKCFPRTLLIEKKMGTKFIKDQTELILKQFNVSKK